MGDTNMEPPIAGNQGHLPPAGYQRNGSMDSADHHMNHSANMKHHGAPPQYSGRGYSHHHHYPRSRPPLPIQSVVTHSFSADEEREDRHFAPRGHFPHPEYRSQMDGREFESRDAPHHEPPRYGREDNHHVFESPHHGREGPLYGRELPPIQEGELSPPHDRPMRVPPSPRGELPPPIHRSLSTGSYRGQGTMKRSFWHHARNGDDYQGSSIPHEFMPPKRSKVSSPGKREYVVTARSQDEVFPPEGHNGSSPQRPPPGWFNRATSWEAREEYYHREPRGNWTRSPPYREGVPGQHWSDAPTMPPSHGPYADYELSPGRSWGQTRWRHDTWGGPQYRDEPESMHLGPESRSREGFDYDMRRQGTFESVSDGDMPMRFIGGPPSTPRGMELSAPIPGTNRSDVVIVGGSMSLDKNGPVRFLALPEDRISLSETLCLVRENVEVFTASLKDVEAPAPGRKHAVVVGQVGLRCIHCRHTTKSSERVKRAICYPSSIKRIYRTVIDMKLDHFLHCKFVPSSLKETLNALKANNTRSTGTTMQYFIRAAKTLGMVDGPTGVRLVQNGSNGPEFPSPNGILTSGLDSPGSKSVGKYEMDSKPAGDYPIERNNSISSYSAGSVPDDGSVPKELFTGKTTLSLPEDKMSLSPLRCFLRDQVCAFSATEEDIAVRTPTTFSVSVGQVGIGCVHCLEQPAKSRLNRAVCFPFSIARIYQSVADIQRFHLGECKMVPPDTKKKFLELQSASSKGSKGLATRQYWVTSANKIGLVDTSKGIRFGRDPSVPEEKPVSLDILAQVASHVTTVNRPLVLPEDKPYIAEFLYLVMDQLQACRFTEADRNKRRLKDVGCIGVECKHCVGQVDSRKFFWSSVNAVESNFVSVHTHMMECQMIPEPLKEQLAELKKLRKEQTAALKTGSQKAFFSRVWKRLHGEGQNEQQQQQEGEYPESPGAEATGSPACSPTASPKKSVEEAVMEAAPESPSTEISDKMKVVSV